MTVSKDGTRIIHELDLKVLFEAAVEEGARKALASVGLGDENAAGDIREARSLVEAFRTAHRTIFSTFVRLVSAAIFGALILGFYQTIKEKIGD